jgi:DNA-binding transcriptional LysR family regulator
MLNLQHLSTFVALQQTASFTLAAERLGISQSTVSQHIQRLEEHLGRKLIWRTTHVVQLTADGEQLLGHAREMLELDGKVATLFNQTRLRGRLRLGVSEDFVASRLTAVLESFIRLHPLVDLELTVDLSGVLYEAQSRGDLDLVLAKRMKDESRGRFLQREPMTWLGRDRVLPLEPGMPVPLIAYPPPSISRRIAIEALEAHGIAWRIVCTCNSLNGLIAAAAAGMGVLVQPIGMAPAGLKEIEIPQLPSLEDVEFVLVPSRWTDRKLVEALWREVQARIGTAEAR